MAKKNDTSNIKNLGKGILDTLSGIESKKVNTEEVGSSLTENSNDMKEEKNNTVNTNEGKTVSEETSNHKKAHTSKKVNSENNNTTKEENNRSGKEQKSKRSFMLTETAIDKLDALKLCMNDKDLSTIVEESINMYFEKNKKSIDSLIERLNRMR